MRFKHWLEYTSAVYDGEVPKTGGGFNWWGAVGHPAGVEIGGEVKTANVDPDGTNSKKNKKRKRERKS